MTAPALWAGSRPFRFRELPALQLGVAGPGSNAPRFTTPLAVSIRNARSEGKLFSRSRRLVKKMSGRFGARLGYAATTMALAVYMLVDPGRSQALPAIVPRQYHVRLARVLLNLETIVGGYVRGQLFTSAAIGVYVFALLTIFGMPSALAFAVFAAAADVVPLVGGALTLIPISFAALPHGTVVTVALIVLVVLYQELENRVLIPRIYGRVLRLDPVAVMIALLIGGQLLGVLGAFLALPMAAGLRMIIEELRVELPGQPGAPYDPRTRDEQRAEETYAALTAGAPAQEAAVVAVAIANEIRRRGSTHGPRAVEIVVKP